MIAQTIDDFGRMIAAIVITGFIVVVVLTVFVAESLHKTTGRPRLFGWSITLVFLGLSVGGWALTQERQEYRDQDDVKGSGVVTYVDRCDFLE